MRKFILCVIFIIYLLVWYQLFKVDDFFVPLTGAVFATYGSSYLLTFFEKLKLYIFLSKSRFITYTHDRKKVALEGVVNETESAFISPATNARSVYFEYEIYYKVFHERRSARWLLYKGHQLVPFNIMSRYGSNIDINPPIGMQVEIQNKKNQTMIDRVLSYVVDKPLERSRTNPFPKKVDMIEWDLSDSKHIYFPTSVKYNRTDLRMNYSSIDVGAEIVAIGHWDKDSQTLHPLSNGSILLIQGNILHAMQTVRSVINITFMSGLLFIVPIHLIIWYHFVR